MEQLGGSFAGEFRLGVPFRFELGTINKYRLTGVIGDLSCRREGGYEEGRYEAFQARLVFIP